MTLLTQEFTLGEPQVAGPLAVFPVLGPDPRLAYRSSLESVGLGAFIKELDEGASVGELFVQNPTDLPFLIYEGEEVLGAQQNRTFDTSVLVAAGAQIRLPVSCVERGRWDGRRSQEHFSVAPQAADPSLRRVKRARANQNAALGLDARADQGEVWREVDAKLADHGVNSATASLHDVYESRRRDLGELTASIKPVDGQLGAVAAIAGQPTALDMVSRPDVFARLLPRLAQGYALDALSAASGDADAARARNFLDTALLAPRRPIETHGLGQAFGVAMDRVVGSALEHEGELVQLSAFPVESDPSQTSISTRQARIAAPSRRRRRL